MTTNSNVATLEPKPSTLTSGGRIAAIVPQTMEDAYRLAKAVCMAGMNPRGMETPEKCMIAIMRGLEVGLTPFQALDKIAIVNGRPTIWGDGAVGLVRGSGLCEYIKETVEGEGEKLVAICETKRKAEREPIRRTFSVADAKKAGLWGKSGPWQQFPARMLQMRARAFALRDGFADVLGGLYLKEELDNGGDGGTTVAPPSIPMPPAPPPPPVATIEPPKPKVVQMDAIDFDDLRAKLRACANLDNLNNVFDAFVQAHMKDASDDEMEEADALLREEAEKFWKDEG